MVKYAIQLSSYPAIQLSSYPAIQLSSYPAIQLSSYPAIQLSSYPAIQLSICLGLCLSNRLLCRLRFFAIVPSYFIHTFILGVKYSLFNLAVRHVFLFSLALSKLVVFKSNACAIGFSVYQPKTSTAVGDLF